MEAKLKEIETQARAAIAAASDEDALREAETEYLGRKAGKLSAVLKGLKDLSGPERGAVGKLANEIKNALEALIAERRESLQSSAMAGRLQKESIDLSLPASGVAAGSLHPLVQMERELRAIFVRMGFTVATGPEVEKDYYNFEALNIPADHPARDMQDTFYIQPGVLLRTHTSPVQIRTMEKREPPVRIIAPGKVYRCDSDPTHSPMFHQIEGLWIDKGVTFADLKGTLGSFIRQVFDSSVKLRFRPSFFPFTEPSAEADMSCVFCKRDGSACSVCKGSGWIEVLGAGMVDPRVFGFVGYDPERSGFAFGLGIERFAMLKYGVPDLRLYFENDVRFLEQVLVKISYQWLKDLVPALELSPQELAEQLTMAGLELEDLEDPSRGWDNVVVGKVEAIEPHPDADKLRLCTVRVGADTVQKIVCGASNVDAGQSVCVALEGAELPGGFKIKKAKIRGVESRGMICSEKELGLAEQSDGILVLEGAQADNEPGTPVAKVLHVPPLLDLSVTPNRGDCLSAIGLAREVAALTGGELHEPEFALNEQDGAASEVASVEVQAPDLCPRYCARVIEGVKIGPSPMWLAELLESHGIRPISNIVDVTNYILLLHGQPLHAFDLDHIGEGKIIVRKAAAGEKMKTLDDVERTLEEGDLVIADPKGPVALAGVMGGASSEVTDSTTRVLLEAAYFEPGTVRRTSRRLGLISESSYRFERGIDPLRVTVAMDHAAAMMAELGGGSVRSGFIDESAQDFAPAKITLRPARVCALLGVEIPAERIAAHLKSLGFGVDDSSAESFAVRVPSWRRLDITLEADLIEEVARIEGYDNVPETLPSSGREHGEDDEPLHLQEALEDALVARGWRQSVHLSFASPGWADDFGIAEGDSRRKAVRIANPINEEEGVLRAALLPSLVKTYVRNRNHGVRQVRLFEVGRVFEEQGAGVAGGELPKERLSLAMIAGTLDEPGLWRAGDPARAALFAAKADLEALGGCFGLELKLAGPSDEPYLHPGRRASVMLGKQVLGHWGELHPEVAAKLGVRDRVVACELDAGALLQAALGRKPKFSAFSNLPRMWRDLALLVSDEVPAGRVVAKALAAGAPLAQHGEIFDEFRGKGIEEGKRSLGLRMCYGAADRTLTEEEAAGAEAKVLETLEKEFGAQRRG